MSSDGKGVVPGLSKTMFPKVSKAVYPGSSKIKFPGMSKAMPKSEVVIGMSSKLFMSGPSEGIAKGLAKVP